MSNKYDKVLGKLREKDEITVDGGAVASVNGLAGEVVLTQDAIPDGTTYKQYSATEKTKLAGIATGATANSSDATLLNRANHTGTQAISTILSLQGTLDSKAPASHTHTASQVTDFDTEVSNNTDVAANTSARHTHANAVALAAVSGTNTGDQDLSGYATTAALAAKENISKVTPIAVSTSTAAGTAAKVATTTGGTYIPTEGDIIRVTFTAANTATNPTINIDGSGAKSILLGGANPTGVAMAGTKVMMWYDGTAFQLFGSQRVSDTDTNTTYKATASFTDVTGTTQSAAVNVGYLANNAAQVAFTLPASHAIGDTIEVIGINTGGWKITAPAGDDIILEKNTTGAAGFITGAQYESVRLRSIVANTTWEVVYYSGAVTTGAGHVGSLGSFGAWTSWTPTVSGITVGNGTLSAAYVKLGKTVHFRVRFTLGTTSALGQTPKISLPITKSTAYTSAFEPIGQVVLSRSLKTTLGVATLSTGDTSIGILLPAAVITHDFYQSPSSITTTAATTGDYLVLSGTYEAA